VREINRIILHCTATPKAMRVDVATIRVWHQAKGWSDCGYHYLIHQDGTCEIGRPVMIKGSHTKGHNADSIGVAYCGGVDLESKPKDTMTMEQEISFLHLVDSLRTTFGPLTLHGHNEYSRKACPSFNVQDKFEFLKLKIDELSN
jgi:N-acetylmuramoyl-L-alanine amidase